MKNNNWPLDIFSLLLAFPLGVCLGLAYLGRIMVRLWTR